MQTTTDEALIGRIAAGDKLAMQVLFARHHVRVYRFVLRLMGDPSRAEDLISEVFLDVWRQADRFEARSQVSTWLLAIARYKALSALRKRPDEELDDETAGRVLALFRVTFGDIAVVAETVEQEPVYLIMAMTPGLTLRMKPQNLLTGLPIKHLEAAS